MISHSDFDTRSEELKKRVVTMNKYLSEVSADPLNRSRVTDNDPISTRSRRHYEPNLFENDRQKERISAAPIFIEDEESTRNKRSPGRKKYEKTIDTIFKSNCSMLVLFDLKPNTKGPESQKEPQVMSTRREKYAGEIDSRDAEYISILI